MGFFKDLFGPPKPCDLCQLGQVSWKSEHAGSRDWRIWGHGLRATLLLCPGCHGFVRRSGLKHKAPLLALALLHDRGMAHRPAPHAYLQHPEWKKVWMHMLDTAGVEPDDEFAALAAIRELEPAFFDRVAEGGPSNRSP